MPPHAIVTAIAQLQQQHYSSNKSTTSTSALCSDILWLNSNTVVEIFLLVVVNAIIDELANATMGVHNMLQAFTLFLYASAPRAP